MTLHAQFLLSFQAYPTANKDGCCFTAALDAKSEAFMLFIVPLTSFGHWSVPTLIRRDSPSPIFRSQEGK